MRPHEAQRVDLWPRVEVTATAEVNLAEFPESFRGAPPAAIPETVEPVAPRIPHKRARAIVGVQWWLSRWSTHEVKVDFHLRQQAFWLSPRRFPRTGPTEAIRRR